MARFSRKFDAKAYWATKPYCTVCKNHKVKEGNICYECKQAAMKQNRELNKNKETDEEFFASTDVEVFLEPRKKRVSNLSAEAQNKVIRLFTYLEKALAVDDSIVRDFRTTTAAPSPWLLVDIPIRQLSCPNYISKIGICWHLHSTTQNESVRKSRPIDKPTSFMPHSQKRDPDPQTLNPFKKMR